MHFPAPYLPFPHSHPGAIQACAVVLLYLTLLGCDSAEKPVSNSTNPAVSDPIRPPASPSADPAKPLPQIDDSPEPASMIRFKELDSGPKFQYQNGEQAEHSTMLETLGGGLAIFDFDGDGSMDLLFTGGGHFGPDEKDKTRISGHPPALYRNNGDHTFTDVTHAAGLARADFFSHGAFTEDYDNDGWPDVLITGYGGLLLFHNNGDGTFQEVSRELGLQDSLWSVAAAWGDINLDGILELYITHYIDWSFSNHPFCTGQNTSFLSRTTDQRRDICSPRDFAALPDQLLQFNQQGQLEDISRDAGIDVAGNGLGVLMADLDLDGDLDIYVTNDTVANFFWRNRGDGTFDEVATLSGVGFDNSGNADGSMGIDMGDYNLDGLPDLFVTNFQNEQFALYRNLGNALFQHVSSSSGMLSFQSVYVGWGTAFVDADNDGDEDLFIANGHVQRYPVESPIAQWPLALENINGRFAKVNQSLGKYFTSPHKGRGIAAGDLDNDGDLDLVYSHINQNCSILINETDNQNQFLALRLIGTRVNRSAVGARVTLTTDRGKQTRQIKGGTSFASSNDPRLYFGIPASSGTIRLEIHWPDGQTQVIEKPDTNRLLTIVQE